MIQYIQYNDTKLMQIGYISGELDDFKQNYVKINVN